jgi:hypothetical protein
MGSVSATTTIQVTIVESPLQKSSWWVFCFSIFFNLLVQCEFS